MIKSTHLHHDHCARHRASFGADLAQGPEGQGLPLVTQLCVPWHGGHSIEGQA